MTDAVKDIAPIIRTMDDLQRIAAANPGKPVVLYFSGKEPDGSNCPACEGFERTHGAVLAKHKSTTAFAQVEVPLTWEGFEAMGNAFGFTSDAETGTLSANGVTFEARTPVMIEFKAGADGKLVPKAVIPTTDATPDQFDKILTQVETGSGAPVILDGKADLALPPEEAFDIAPPAPPTLAALTQQELVSIGTAITGARTDAKVIKAVEQFYAATGAKPMDGLGTLTDTEITAVLNRMQGANITPERRDELRDLGAALGVKVANAENVADPATAPGVARNNDASAGRRA